MVDPATIAAIGTIAAPIIGGELGRRRGKGSYSDAQRSLEAALAQFQGIELPEYMRDLPVAPSYEMPGDVRFAAPEYRDVSRYDPDQILATQQGESALGGISLDPELRRAQMAALQGLQDVGADGMGAEDRFRMAQMQQDVSRQERGSREALLQSMQQRGISGSGLELAAQLSNQQSAAEQARMQQLGIQSMAESRALEAMTGAGGLAGQIRGQEFGEQAQVGQAQDAIARFNAQQSAATQAANVAARNQAQLTNRDLQIQGAREQADATNLTLQDQAQRAAARNQARQAQYGNVLGQTQYQNELSSQAYQDALAKAGGASGQYQAMSGLQAQKAKDVQTQYAKYGQAASEGLTSYFSNQAKKKPGET